MDSYFVKITAAVLFIFCRAPRERRFAATAARQITQLIAGSAGTLARWACVSTLNAFLFNSMLR